MALVPARNWFGPALIAASGVVAADIAWFALDPQCVDGACRVDGILRSISRALTHFGEGYETLVPAGLLLLAYFALPRLWPGRVPTEQLASLAWRAWFVLASVGGTGIVSSLVKNSIGRARPHVATMGDPYVFLPFQFKAAYAAFPSGHATTAGATAMLLTLLWPPGWPVFQAASVVFALTRITLGAHYPSDVAAGYAFGAAGTLALAHLFAARGRVFRPATGIGLPVWTWR